MKFEAGRTGKIRADVEIRDVKTNLYAAQGGLKAVRREAQNEQPRETRWLKAADQRHARIDWVIKSLDDAGAGK